MSVAAARRSVAFNSLAGQWSSIGVSLVGAAYAVALIVGFVTRGLSSPIVDPLLAIMELLTTIAAPLLLVMMAAIHGRASNERPLAGLVALVFMALATGITSVVHFVQLTAMRQLGTAGLVWPSPLYAAELLAWDVFVGLSLVFAACALETTRGHRLARIGLLTCGVLCLFGVLGPASGRMRLQFVGVFGYGVVLPVVCLSVSDVFRHDRALTVWPDPKA